jgi:hypothetical protein
MEPTVPSKEIHPATGMVPHVAAKTEAKDRAQSILAASAEDVAAWNADVKENGWTDIEDLEREYGLV